MGKYKTNFLYLQNTYIQRENESKRQRDCKFPKKA